MKEVVFDTETDGLAYDCTKMHILSYTSSDMVCTRCFGDGTELEFTDEEKLKTITCSSCGGDGKAYHSTASYEEMVEFFNQEDTLFVCHNSVPFDMVVVNRILGIPMDYKKYVDTLAVSWFLEPERKSHGLGSYQEESGLVKPVVDDWENVTYEQMKHRCESDVKLNWWLWQKQRKKLQEIYG